MHALLLTNSMVFCIVIEEISNASRRSLRRTSGRDDQVGNTHSGE